MLLFNSYGLIFYEHVDNEFISSAIKCDRSLAFATVRNKKYLQFAALILRSQTQHSHQTIKQKVLNFYSH